MPESFLSSGDQRMLANCETSLPFDVVFTYGRYQISHHSVGNTRLVQMTNEFYYESWQGRIRIHSSILTKVPEQVPPCSIHFPGLWPDVVQKEILVLFVQCIRMATLDYCSFPLMWKAYRGSILGSSSELPFLYTRQSAAFGSRIGGHSVLNLSS